MLCKVVSNATNGKLRQAYCVEDKLRRNKLCRKLNCVEDMNGWNFRMNDKQVFFNNNMWMAVNALTQSGFSTQFVSTQSSFQHILSTPYDDSIWLVSISWAIFVVGWRKLDKDYDFICVSILSKGFFGPLAKDANVNVERENSYNNNRDCLN